MIHAPPVALYRRIPWFAIVLALAVILSSAFAVSPLRDVVTLQDAREVRLARPIGYVMLAPLSGVLDVLTLLSRNQHRAFAAGCLVLFAAWRAYRGWRRALGWRDHLIASLAFVATLIALYAAAVLLPRPMAALVAEDADILRVDFHSHTSASRDAPSWWTAERNRAWHRSGGYDVAYITDHSELTQAERAMVRNPVRAGDGVTLLLGIETRASGEHVAFLRPHERLLAPNGDLDPQALHRESLVAGREPVVILNHPRVPERLPIGSDSRPFGVHAIEVANGAPILMDVVRLSQARILSTAENRNLMMTTGSDAHGWGHTAPNWTLLMVPNWRGLTSDALAAQIENLARNGGTAASRVVERRTADGTNPLMLALTVLAAPARMLTTLSMSERIAWLVWIALFVVGQRIARARAHA